MVSLPGAAWLRITADGFVDGNEEGLRYILYADGWALYSLDDVPERFSPEKVAAAFAANPPQRAPRKKR